MMIIQNMSLELIKINVLNQIRKNMDSVFSAYIDFEWIKQILILFAFLKAAIIFAVFKL